jgi:hypothetical protein
MENEFLLCKKYEGMVQNIVESKVVKGWVFFD